MRVRIVRDLRLGVFGRLAYSGCKCIEESMEMPRHVPDVGAPDPELQNSPIFEEDEEILSDAGLESGACYFNGVSYPIGQYVRSGSELLHCEGHGMWVSVGEIEPDEEA